LNVKRSLKARLLLFILLWLMLLFGITGGIFLLYQDHVMQAGLLRHLELETTELKTEAYHQAQAVRPLSFTCFLVYKMIN